MPMTLTWQETNIGETSHEVYRTDVSYPNPALLPAPIAVLGANAVSYVDNDVIEGNVYYYRVAAVRGGDRVYSSELAAQAEVEPIELPPSLGEPWKGGFFAGTVAIGGINYHVILAPKSSEAAGLKWKTTSTDTAGTGSATDGALVLTSAIVAAGIANHPAAQYCNDYVNGGFDDWVLPCNIVMLLLSRNLNPNSAATPDPFKAGQAQAFNTAHPANYYWTCHTAAPATAGAGRPSSPTTWNYDKQTTTVTTRPIRLHVAGY